MSEQHAAVGSYVVHALDEADRTQFEAHLATCPSCAVEVGELSEAVAELSWLVRRPPPAALRASVASAVMQVRPAPPWTGSTALPAMTTSTTATGPRRVLARRRPRAFWFALAAALLAVVGLGGAVVDLGQQRQEQLVASQAQTRLLTAADAKVYTETLAGGTGVSFVVSKALDQALFTAADLPVLDAQHAYQLWSTDAAGAHPSTVFSDAGDVQVWMRSGVKTGTGVALTVEPSGGSARPTTDALVTETL